ncbi:NUDIX hydrolase [Streptomyces zinciresistens]|uniref:NUDIX hydrolase n=1 Tax=Streptomyces zinciresistens TaxID=1073330 RepID=UPI00142F2BBC|nr:NUDIX domain-containing protein [Streptomyces zinciresistens]
MVLLGVAYEPNARVGRVSAGAGRGKIAAGRAIVQPGAARSSGAASVDSMTAVPVREAARVIVLDDDQRVLLLRYDENDGFWATPGGAVTRGETYAAAAVRELGEELGVAKEAVTVEAQLAQRSREHMVGGRTIRQVERYFPARLTAGDINPDRATQRDNIRDHRWWPLDELRATRETVYPRGLAAVVEKFLEHGVPERPVVLE